MKQLTLFICFLLPMIVLSQANILNAKSPEEIGENLYVRSLLTRPLEYEFVDDKDVLFLKQFGKL